MHVDELRRYCLAFPDATETMQWGDNLCFKVRGKIFAILGLDDRRMCFKCAPDAFADLIEREEIHPAPYLGRYQWVMLDRLDALRHDELKNLIGQSYAMVAAKAPKPRPRKSVRKQKSGKRKASGIKPRGKKH